MPLILRFLYLFLSGVCPSPPPTLFSLGQWWGLCCSISQARCWLQGSSLTLLSQRLNSPESEGPWAALIYVSLPLKIYCCCFSLLLLWGRIGLSSASSSSHFLTFPWNRSQESVFPFSSLGSLHWVQKQWCRVSASFRIASCLRYSAFLWVLHFLLQDGSCLIMSS